MKRTETIRIAEEAYLKFEKAYPGFLEEKVIRKSKPPGEWLIWLKTLSELDRQGDAARSAANVLLGWSIAAAVVAAIAALVVGTSMKSPILLFMGLIPMEVVAIRGAVLGARARRRLGKTDIPRSLIRFAVPVISILREEVASKSPIALELDLRGGTIAEKQQRSGPSGRYSEAHFVDPWFSGSATFTDGARLEWSVVDYIRRRTRQKRRSTVVKHKIQTVMEARVGFPVKNYTVHKDPAAEDIALKSGEKRNRVRVRRLGVKTDPALEYSLDLFLDAIATAYRQVRLADDARGAK